MMNVDKLYFQVTGGAHYDVLGRQVEYYDVIFYRNELWFVFDILEGYIKAISFEQKEIENISDSFIIVNEQLNKKHLKVPDFRCELKTYIHFNMFYNADTNSVKAVLFKPDFPTRFSYIDNLVDLVPKNYKIVFLHSISEKILSDEYLPAILNCGFSYKQYDKNHFYVMHEETNVSFMKYMFYFNTGFTSRSHIVKSSYEFEVNKVFDIKFNEKTIEVNGKIYDKKFIDFNVLHLCCAWKAFLNEN